VTFDFALGTTVCFLRSICGISGGVAFGQADRGSKSHTHGLDGFPGVAFGAVSDDKGLPWVSEGDLLEVVNLLLETIPVQTPATSFHFSLQVFQKHQCQKTAENVSPDGLIKLVVNGPRP